MPTVGVGVRVAGELRVPVLVPVFVLVPVLVPVLAPERVLVPVRVGVAEGVTGMHTACTIRRLRTSMHGSPKRALVAGTAHVVRPTHADATFEAEVLA